jgi:hypothetical protein
MKRLLISFVGAALLVGVLAMPVGAAKGSTKIASVRGTISGTQTVTTTCGWATYDNGQGGGPTYQQYWINEISVQGAALNASTLGSGTTSWYITMSPFQNQPSQWWTFTGSNPANTLAGWPNFNGGMGGGSNYSFNVNSGTGKFAGVKYGPLQSLQTQVTFPNCDPGSAPPNPPTDPAVVDVESATSPLNLTIYGQLIF